MKKTTLITTLVLCFCVQSFAGIQFIANKKWKEILALAAKENKLIFLDGYATWCGPCSYMKKEVFPLKKVGDYYNEHFINVQLNMEIGEGITLAEKYNLTAYPTLYFINGKGEVVHKSVGALSAAELIALGKNAVDPNKQFYTLQRLGAQGKLNPGAFHQWLHDAKNVDKESISTTLAKYMQHVSYSILDKEMLAIIFDHEAPVSEAQLDFLYAHKQEIKSLMEMDDKKVEGALVQKVRSFVFAQYGTDKEVNLASIQNIYRKYVPANASTETRMMEMRCYFQNKEQQKGIATMLTLLQQHEYKMPVLDLTLLLADYVEEIVGSSRMEEVIQSLKAYELLPSDSDRAYCLDLTLFSVYLEKEDELMMKEYANRIIMNENAPATLKEKVNKVLDLGK